MDRWLPMAAITERQPLLIAAFASAPYSISHAAGAFEPERREHQVDVPALRDGSVDVGEAIAQCPNDLHRSGLAQRDAHQAALDRRSPSVFGARAERGVNQLRHPFFPNPAPF